MSDFVMFLGQALVISACVGVLVMGLGLFFQWLPRVGPQKPGLHVRSAGELFEENSIYDVVLSSGQRLAGLRFEGLVQADGDGGWPLRQFAVLRRADGGKVFVRIESVRVFEEVAQATDES